MSDRILVSVREISAINAIPGADRVELAHVDGWRCVVLKNDFKVGQKVLFFETDCALTNVNDDRFSFLRKSSYKSWKSGDVFLGECLRIKTVRLAGQISQGVLMPTALFEDEIARSGNNNRSLMEIIGIRHYDDLKEDMNFLLGNAPSQNSRGSFPFYVPKTDEDYLQNNPVFFESCKGMSFEVTVKMDGSSMSVGYSPTFYPDNPYFVCSRKLSLKDGDDNFNRVARENGLEKILREYFENTGDEICIQGELVGPGINGNQDKFAKFGFYVFRIWNITKGIWFSPYDRLLFCQEHGINHVKVLSSDTKIFDLFDNIDGVVDMTKNLVTDNCNPIEGLVFKSIDGVVSFKVINPLYLLKNDL